jgi:Family of unknown function (DUF5302)
MTESAPRKAPQASTKPASAKPAGTKPTATEADAAKADAAKADPEPVAAPSAPDDAPGTSDNDGKPDMDEVKRKFREALDRKREIHAEGSTGGSRDPGKIHDAHGPARSRRDFRRKSG